jgi:minor extracellular serine protease Vpr
MISLQAIGRIAAIILVFSNLSFGQAAMNLGAKRLLNEYNTLNMRDASAVRAFVAQYDLIPFGKSGDYFVGVSAIIDEENFNASVLLDLGIKNDTRIRDLWTFRVPVSRLIDFINLKGLSYIEIAEPVEPDLIRSTVDSRTDSVNQGLGLLGPVTGRGVIIAIIDWGFDYTHPNFFDSTLTELRISRAWDQNKQSGPAPEGYSFGTEYIGREALLQAKSDTLYVFGPISHGTHVGGIAAGSGGGTPYTGAAPDAELIFISLRRDGPSLVDAFQYVADYAASVDKPFVVNMSFGSHLGPHDGSSLKNYAMDMLHGPGRIFVGSAGNNGNANFHLGMNFTNTPGDTMQTIVGFGSGTDIFGQTVSMWGSSQSSFSASLALVSNSGQIILETPFYNTAEELSVDHTEDVDGGDFRFIMDTEYGHFLNDKPSIRWQIRNTTPNRVLLRVTSEDSHVHMWNCMRHIDRFTNWGQPFLSNYPDALAGDILYGVGEPAGVGRSVITVGSYLREVTTPSGSLTGGTMSAFTSSGPTVDERIKPDISSTGQSVVSSVSSFDPSQENATIITQKDGESYGFTAFSGTSMSSPMVAGMVALMLEVNPNLSAEEVRGILKETARLDQQTGELPVGGDLRWGFGKANALAAVKAVIGLISSSEEFLSFSEVSVFPNPASSEFTIRSRTMDYMLVEIILYDLNGTQVIREVFSTPVPEANISTINLSEGAYLLQYKAVNGFGFGKVMVVR